MSSQVSPFTNISNYFKAIAFDIVSNEKYEANESLFVISLPVTKVFWKWLTVFGLGDFLQYVSKFAMILMMI